MYIISIFVYFELFTLADHYFMTVPADSTIKINCTSDLRVKIGNITVKQAVTKCQKRELCSLTDDEINAIKLHCMDKNVCEVMNDNHGCIQDYGYYNLTYDCQDVFESKMVIELLQMKRDEEMEWNQLFDRTVELAGGVDVLPSIHRRAIRQQHRVKAPVANPLNVSCSCTFESGLCNWSINNDSKTYFRWKPCRGRTCDGPHADHTLGSSFYGLFMYLYATNNDDKSPTDKAQLISPQIVPSDVQCVSFWYHMNGNNDYKIALYQNETMLNVTTTIWNISGVHGNRWHEARIETRNRPSPYQLVFEVIRGDSNYGEIALDDINIDNRPCNVSHHNCDFEQSLCGWNVETEAKAFTWIRIKGRTPTTYTGPNRDHTTGSDDGFYVYINAENGRDHETARFFSPNLHASDNSCFTFWYIMYASSKYESDMGTLRVYKDSIQTDRIVWEVSGNQRYRWIKAAIDIHQGDFKIIFEGIRGSSKRSDIAIDDISLTKGTCSGITRHTTTCFGVEEIINLQGCPKHYLEPDSVELSFDPVRQGCSDVYSSADLLLSTTCRGLNESQNCFLDLHDSLHNNPECFRINELVIEYSCEDTTAVYQLQRPGTSTTMEISIGVIGGLAVIACVVTVLVFILRRSRYLHISANKNIPRGIIDREKDYSGHQNVDFPNSTQHVSQNRISCENRNTAVYSIASYQYEYASVKQDDSDNYENNTAYEMCDSRDIDFNTGNLPQPNLPKNQLVLNQVQTAFKEQRTDEEDQMFNDYDVAMPIHNDISDKQNENILLSNDTYIIPEDGTYDHSHNTHHAKTESNLYSHTIDDVYDVTRQDRRPDGQEDTYDHFFGNKTEDDYDISGT